ncbi:MAG: hypothetical protein NTY47_04225, partial [Candidatus Omnitrophica bacterium]|nr:hypothetical protein [Candidatus Omnitrophota bacterium]
NGGENWGAKSPQTITWDTRGNIPRVKLDYSTDDGATWNTIIAATANTGSYAWTLPDIKSSNVKLRVNDADDATVTDSSDAAFSIVYFTVKFSVLDYDTLQHLADFNVNEPATNWTDSGVASPITRTSIYPYGTYTTFFTKTDYIDNSVTWTTPKEGTSTYMLTAYMENSASAQVTWESILTYSYSPADDNLNAVGSLQRKGKLVGTTDLERADMGGATLTIYEPNGITIRKSLSATTPSNSGTYTFTYANTLFEAGKVYPANLSIEYRGRPYVSSANIDVGAEKLQYDFFTKTAKNLSESVASIQQSVAGGTAQTKADIQQSAEAVKAHVSDVLTSTETKIAAKVDEAKAITELAMKSQILNTESSLKTGDTLVVRYRTYSGLKPVMDVYNSANVQEMTKVAMTEIGNTGIYERSVKFETGWGKGEFTIVCSESTKGSLDAMTISVLKTNIEQVYSQISAVLGSTSGITGLKSVADSMNSQFSVIESALSKVGKDLVKEVKDATSSAGALESVFAQLSNVAKQIKSMSTGGVNLEQLYQVSSDKKQDITYLKNKTQELKAAMDISQKMMDNVANKPVTQTWYEYR